MKSARSEGKFVYLFFHCPGDRRVAMSLVQCRVAAEHVEIFLIFNIPDPDPATAFYHNREGVVVLCAKSIRKFNVFPVCFHAASVIFSIIQIIIGFSRVVSPGYY